MGSGDADKVDSQPHHLAELIFARNSYGVFVQTFLLWSAVEIEGVYVVYSFVAPAFLKGPHHILVTGKGLNIEKTTTAYADTNCRHKLTNNGHSMFLSRKHGVRLQDPIKVPDQEKKMTSEKLPQLFLNTSEYL